MKHRKNNTSWGSEIICPAIALALHPANIIDVGCGNGDMVQWFCDHGILAVGVEEPNMPRETVLSRVRDKILYLDLCVPWIEEDFSFCFDLAISIHVAENIHPNKTEAYLRNLTMLSRNILMVIAHPDSFDKSGINIQSSAYWDARFNNLGYQRDSRIEWELKKALVPYRSDNRVYDMIHHLSFYRGGINDSSH